jgi:hypothetical protein
MPARSRDALFWQAERTAPLTSAVAALNELHAKGGAVKYLLRWLNRNAHDRCCANWPSAMELCPTVPRCTNYNTHRCDRSRSRAATAPQPPALDREFEAGAVFSPAASNSETTVELILHRSYLPRQSRKRRAPK